MKHLPTLHPHVRARQNGASLVEILVAVLLVTVGVVGMAALQAKSLRNMNSSAQRTAVAYMLESAMEFIRADTEGQSNPTWSQYTLVNHTVAGSLPPTSNRMRPWLVTFQPLTSNALPPDVTLSVNCTTSTPQTCNATAQWDDQRGSAGAAAQTMTITTRIR